MASAFTIRISDQFRGIRNFHAEAVKGIGQKNKRWPSMATFSVWVKFYDVIRAIPPPRKWQSKGQSLQKRARCQQSRGPFRYASWRWQSWKWRWCPSTMASLKPHGMSTWWKAKRFVRRKVAMDMTCHNLRTAMKKETRGMPLVLL